MACSDCGTCLPTVTIPDIPTDNPISGLEDIGVVTTEALDGTGVFDKYMRAANLQMQSQYDAGRIKGADYASAYVKMVEVMMGQANQFVIAEYSAKIDAKIKIELFPYTLHQTKYDIALKAAQTGETMAKTELSCTQTKELVANGKKDRELKTSQISVQGAQKFLYERQTTAFDDKKHNDNLKIVTDSWAVQASEMNEAGTSRMNILNVDGIGYLNSVLSSII